MLGVKKIMIFGLGHVIENFLISSSGLYWTRIGAIKAYPIVYQKFINFNT